LISAKTVFHLVGLNLRGEVVVRRKCSRTQLLQFTENIQADLIGMEACAGAHFLGRALREQGHEVRIIPAQYVKPYVKTNKSDFIDAEAIGEAVARPTMRFVPIKTDDQLDMQSLHRVRERWGHSAHRSRQPDPRSCFLNEVSLSGKAADILRPPCPEFSKMPRPGCLELFAC